MKYIDAEKLRAEIERQSKSIENATGDFAEGRRLEQRVILSFLDTLEAETSYDTQRYTPSPFVDIGDVARVQFASHAKVFDKKRKAVFDWEQFKEVAGIFYGLGQRNNTLEEPVSDCHDLEEEISTWIPAQIIGGDNEVCKNAKAATIEWAGIVARHFAEWGEKNAYKAIMKKADEVRDKRFDTDYEIKIEPAAGFDLGCVNVYSEGKLVGQYVEPKEEKRLPEDLEEAKEEYLRKARRTPGHEWMTRDIADAFKAGAEWQKAKQESALTIEDVEKLHTFLCAVKNNKHGAFTFTRLSDEQYEEVLRRFNKTKEL